MKGEVCCEPDRIWIYFAEIHADEWELVTIGQIHQPWHDEMQIFVESDIWTNHSTDAIIFLSRKMHGHSVIQCLQIIGIIVKNMQEWGQYWDFKNGWFVLICA